MKKITKLDLIVITAVVICISSFIYIVSAYTQMQPENTDQCWYEIEYLHMSGKVETTKEYCTCQGFHHWYDGNKYKIEMTIPFSDGRNVHIQGATDILSVKKIP